MAGIPKEKIIFVDKGVNLLVDAFRYAPKAPPGSLFFLTHGHSDHYTGLQFDWSGGPIYCTALTARLISHLLNVPPTAFRTLTLNAPTQLPCGVEVTLIDANHCPGACQFLFQLPDGRRIVHTGDFRFCKAMLSCPLLARFKGADAVYLDTTYANPKYTFLLQEDSVRYVADTVERMLEEDRAAARRRLYLITTYVIGKERILEAVAARCGVKICVSERKAGVMACLDLPDELFTTNPDATPVHVVQWGSLGETWPFFRPNFKGPVEYAAERGAAGVVGFVPTGWTHAMGKEQFPVFTKEDGGGSNSSTCSIHLVPYSEHSSFSELLEFVGHLRPVEVIPTVNAGDEKSVASQLKHFARVVDQDAAKAKFISKFTKVAAAEQAKRAAATGGGGGLAAAADPLPIGAEVGEVVELLSDDSRGGGRAAAEEEERTSGAVAGPSTAFSIDVIGGGLEDCVAGTAADPGGPSNADGGGESTSSAAEMLVGLTDGALTAQQAQQLLAKEGGDVSRAADAYFSGRWQPSTAAAGKAPKSSPPSSATKGKGSGTKRKRNEPDPAQRSIRSFFGGGTKTAAAAQQQQSPPSAITLVASQETATPAAIPTTTHMSLTSPNSKAAAGLSAAAPKDAVTLPVTLYHPIRCAPWSSGQPTPYLHLARAFQAMDATTKRLAIGDTLCNAFRSVLALAPQDLAPFAYLTVGKLAPDYEGLELGVGGSAVAGAIQEACGVSRTRLRDMYNQMGDLGDVAAACKRTQTVLVAPKPLTVVGLYADLRGIAAEHGSGAAGRRKATVMTLLRRCREAETKYLVRTLVQALRIGANWRSMVPALAKAVAIHRRQAEALQQQLTQGEGGSEEVQLPPPPPKSELDAVAAAATAAFHCCPNLGLLVAALLTGPLEELEQRCKLTPGVPIKPMLAKISRGVEEAVVQLRAAPFLAEYKYDGVRAQIHVMATPSAVAEGGIARAVKVFSRNCEDRTDSFPDVAAQVLEAMGGGGARSCILDAEVVAVERGANNGSGSSGKMRLKPFQELANRPRTAVEFASLHDKSVCVFVFDLLERDGESLLKRPLQERRVALAHALPNMKAGYVQLAQGIELGPAVSPSGGAHHHEEAPAPGAAEVAAVQQALAEALAAGAEGLMLKSLSARYEPSKRSEHWVKLKKDYCDGHDTLDLVPIGAWHGSGRKAGWFSPFLLAAYNPDTEALQSVCRCMSGFSDEFYRQATERLQHTVIPTPKPYYVTGERPDVWFDAKEVWEVRGADMTLSPVHAAAAGRIPGSERGVSIRFPRFERVRDDKEVEDATTAEAIAEAYLAQSKVEGGRRTAEDERGEAAGGEEG